MIERTLLQQEIIVNPDNAILSIQANLTRF